MKYNILSALWLNEGHTVMGIRAQELDGQGKQVRTFHYTAGENGAAPLNKLLWEEAMKNPGQVKESDNVQVLSGKKPVPEGFEIINGYMDKKRLRNIKHHNATVIGHINNRLNELYSGRAAALAERDPVFAAKRKAQVDELLAMTKKPGALSKFDMPEKLDFDQAMMVE